MEATRPIYAVRGGPQRYTEWQQRRIQEEEKLKQARERVERRQTEETNRWNAEVKEYGEAETKRRQQLEREILAADDKLHTFEVE